MRLLERRCVHPILLVDGVAAIALSLRKSLQYPDHLALEKVRSSEFD